jgi:hypothetical protein
MESRDQNYVYVPVREAPGTPTDLNIYYAIIRDVIDGAFFPQDPIYESGGLKNGIKRHEASYHLSLIISSLGGIFTKRTEHAFYFNYFVWPAINFFLMVLLIHRIAEFRYLSIMLAISIIVFSDIYLPHHLIKNISLFASSVFSNKYNLLEQCQLARTPNIQFTNIHLFVFVLLMHSYFYRCVRSIGMHIGLGLLLAVSPLISTSNFILCYAMFAVSIIVFRINLNKLGWISISIFWGLAMAGFLIGAALSIEVKHFFDNFIIYNSMGYMYGIVSKKYIVNFIFLAVIPTFLLFFVRISQKTFVLALLTGCIISYALTTFTAGSYYANKLYIRGSALLISCLVLSSAASAMRVCFESNIFSKFCGKLKSASKVIKKLFDARANMITIGRALTCVVSVFMLLAVMSNQYAIYKSSYRDYNGPEFKELFDWARKNIGRNDVLVTMDSDLYINLPVYIPGFMYVPIMLNSSVDYKEHFTRFFEVMKFYGVPPEEFNSVIGGVMSYELATMPGTGPLALRKGLLGMLLFYNKYCGFPIGTQEQKNLANTYRNMFADGRGGFSYKADYLITSKFDRQWIKSGSMADRVTIQTKPAFENSLYNVFKLNNG